MKIGELAQLTGVTTKTIRYYEDIGLMPEADRDPNDYRNYTDEAVNRLKFVRDAQATGLTLTEIASILDLREGGHGTCDHVAELLEHHLHDLDKHIEELRAARSQLTELLKRARALDPEDCTDAVRCQTITENVPRVVGVEPVHHHG